MLNKALLFFTWAAHSAKPKQENKMQVHLNKGGAGMAIKTACGRNILRTPVSATWAEFNAEPDHRKCEKCANSKQAALNSRTSK